MSASLRGASFTIAARCCSIGVFFDQIQGVARLRVRFLSERPSGRVFRLKLAVLEVSSFHRLKSHQCFVRGSTRAMATLRKAARCVADICLKIKRSFRSLGVFARDWSSRISSGAHFNGLARRSTQSTDKRRRPFSK